MNAISQKSETEMTIKINPISMNEKYEFEWTVYVRVGIGIFIAMKEWKFKKMYTKIFNLVLKLI